MRAENSNSHSELRARIDLIRVEADSRTEQGILFYLLRDLCDVVAALVPGVGSGEAERRQPEEMTDERSATVPPLTALLAAREQFGEALNEYGSAVEEYSHPEFGGDALRMAAAFRRVLSLFSAAQADAAHKAVEGGDLISRQALREKAAKVLALPMWRSAAERFVAAIDAAPAVAATLDAARWRVVADASQLHVDHGSVAFAAQSYLTTPRVAGVCRTRDEYADALLKMQSTAAPIAPHPSTRAAAEG